MIARLPLPLHLHSPPPPTKTIIFSLPPMRRRERLDSVLRVIYLVFNEGYSASSGDSLTRHDLSNEAIRLARLLVELLPEPEAMGLLACCCMNRGAQHAVRRRAI